MEFPNLDDRRWRPQSPFGRPGARGLRGVERKPAGWCQWRSCARSICIQSHILPRSETSSPGGSPPADVTQRIRRGRRAGRPAGCLNSRRKARSRISRNVVLVSSAFRLASRRRASGSSTVVFIQFPILPYLWGNGEATIKPRTSRTGPRYETSPIKRSWLYAFCNCELGRF